MSRKAAFLAGGLLVALAIVVAAVVIRGGNESVAPSPTTPVPHPQPTLERVNDLAARVLPGNQVALRASPGGPILARVGARTEFGSPQTLEVALREGDWLAVRSPALGNKQLGWVNTNRTGLRVLKRNVRVEVDLSKRTLTLIKHGVVSRRDAVAIGSSATPTPPGEFYVTDKLAGPDFGSYYGCCILALSGRQPNLPQGWSGGDRLAIHGTPKADFGQAVTNGCLHLPSEVLQVLMRDVPLGTPVRIRA
ncbi:MAG: L,D-transpeptidase [Actinomycetota bacterium]